MRLSSKVFTFIFLLIGILSLGFGVFIIINISNDPSRELIIDRPQLSTLTPTQPQITRSEERRISSTLISSSDGSVVSVTDTIREYNLLVSNSSLQNPLNDLRLFVEPINISLELQNEPTVLELTPAIEPIFDNSNQVWSYKFLWEGFNSSSNLVLDGAYKLTLKSTVFGEALAPRTCINCGNFVTISDDTPNTSIFTIAKNSIQTCTQEGDTNINYIVRVRNIGAQSGVFNFLEDRLDSKFNSIPISINPNGTFENNKIVWSGTTDQRRIQSNEVKEFTYSITIPREDVELFDGSGFVNTAELNFGDDNFSSFTLRTNPICGLNISTTPTPTPQSTISPTLSPSPTPNQTITPSPSPVQTPIVSTIPNTFLGDDLESLRGVLYGLLLIIVGLLIYHIRLETILSRFFTKNSTLSKTFKNNRRVFETKVTQEIKIKQKK